MVTDIDELNERMTDPNETFTPEEVQALIDWNVTRATNDEYQKTRIAAVMQGAAATTEFANESMSRLEALWDASTMVPELEVIDYEPAQA